MAALRPIGEGWRAGRLLRWSPEASTLPVDPDARALVFASRARQILTALLLAAGTILGGSDVPAFTLAIELIAVLLLFTTLSGPSGSPRFALGAKLLIGVAVAVPIVQLLPIPTAMWGALPGRELAREIQAQAAVLGRTHAISLDPSATRRAGLSLLPPIAMFLATLRAGRHERLMLTALAALIALGSATVGAVQFSTGDLYPYATPHYGDSVGLFTNRNHQADLLIAGMFLVVALAREQRTSRGSRLLAGALVLMLAMCVVTTTSRMGNFLMPIAVLANGALLIGTGSARTWWWIGCAAALAGIAVLLLSTNPVVQATFGRFGDSADDSRFGYWQDAMVALRAYWPVGSGLGTFVPAYAAVEDLDFVGYFYINHAHNDYVELVMEAGIGAVLGILAYAVLLARQAIRVNRGRDCAMRAAGLGIIVDLLAHSGVDYPLRTFAMMILFAFANALIYGSPEDYAAPQRGKARTVGRVPFRRGSDKLVK